MPGTATSTLVVTGFLMLALAGCGGGSDSPADTQQAGNSPDQPSEVALRETSRDFAQAVVDEDWARVYGFFHKRFRDRCPFEDAVRLLTLVSRSELERFKNAEARVEGVRIEGTKGYPSFQYYRDGRPLVSETPNEGGPWLWEDGRWWVGAFDPDPAPCEVPPTPT